MEREREVLHCTIVVVILIVRAIRAGHQADPLSPCSCSYA
jgi:hypothetical protein